MTLPRTFNYTPTYSRFILCTDFHVFLMQTKFFLKLLTPHKRSIWPAVTYIVSTRLNFIYCRLECMYLSNTALFGGRYMFRIYYIKNNYMFRHLTLAIFSLRNGKQNLVSCYTRLMWAVYNKPYKFIYCLRYFF